MHSVSIKLFYGEKIKDITMLARISILEFILTSVTWISSFGFFLKSCERLPRRWTTHKINYKTNVLKRLYFSLRYSVIVALNISWVHQKLRVTVNVIFPEIYKNKQNRVIFIFYWTRVFQGVLRCARILI
jgi:hypothetical protein